MTDAEQKLLKLETTFPALSDRAFATAREQALAAGLSVLQAEEGIIYRVSPDGSRSEVKKIEAPSRVLRGSRFTIR